MMLKKILILQKMLTHFRLKYSPIPEQNYLHKTF